MLTALRLPLCSQRREVELCRQSVLRLSLLHPSVAFTLVDAYSGQQLLHLPRGRSETWLLGQALGGEHLDRATHVARAAGHVSLEGYLVEAPFGFPDRSHQFM